MDDDSRYTPSSPEPEIISEFDSWRPDNVPPLGMDSLRELEPNIVDISTSGVELVIALHEHPHDLTWLILGNEQPPFPPASSYLSNSSSVNSITEDMQFIEQELRDIESYSTYNPGLHSSSMDDTIQRSVSESCVQLDAESSDFQTLPPDETTDNRNQIPVHQMSFNSVDGQEERNTKGTDSDEIKDEQSSQTLTGTIVVPQTLSPSNNPRLAEDMHFIEQELREPLPSNSDNRSLKPLSVDYIDQRNGVSNNALNSESCVQLDAESSNNEIPFENNKASNSNHPKSGEELYEQADKKTIIQVKDSAGVESKQVDQLQTENGEVLHTSPSPLIGADLDLEISTCRQDIQVCQKSDYLGNTSSPKRSMKRKRNKQMLSDSPQIKLLQQHQLKIDVAVNDQELVTETVKRCKRGQLEPPCTNTTTDR